MRLPHQICHKISNLQDVHQKKFNHKHQIYKLLIKLNHKYMLALAIRGSDLVEFDFFKSGKQEED